MIVLLLWNHHSRFIRRFTEKFKFKSAYFIKYKTNTAYQQIIYLYNKIYTVNELGIIYDSNLNFRIHIDASWCKALKALGFLKRICNQFKLLAPLKALYCAFVRFILESAIVIWDPQGASDMNQLERVQRKFLSFVAYLKKIEHRYTS